MPRLLTRPTLLAVCILAMMFVVTSPTAVYAVLCYPDQDSDTYGDATDPGTDFPGGCPSGYVENNLDCDDTDANVFPGATEICDGLDNDCDGAVDNNAADATTWYRDQDSDGYGDPSVDSVDCSMPVGYVDNDSDCDDTDPGVNPGATEIVADGIDQNCDGLEACWVDNDGDGFGGLSTTTSSDFSCSSGGVAANSLDCDDSDPSVYPGATEFCNGLDNDCDGTADNNPADAQTWYLDNDSDGFGDPNVDSVDCAQPAGYVGNNSDCDDTQSSTYPGADEFCDGIDNDCDGLVDSNAVDASTWYRDADSDGYGDASDLTVACSLPIGYVADNTDCDDTNPNVNPGATEVVADGIDQNCDGLESCWVDNDGDSFGGLSTTTSSDFSCSSGGVSANSLDCNDMDPSVYPGATEIPGNGIDEDCDGADGAGCCLASAGNVDCDTGDITDVGDLTQLIGFLFLGSPVTLCCPAEANIDGDTGCVIDVGDLTALIGFLFLGGVNPAACGSCP